MTMNTNLCRTLIAAVVAATLSGCVAETVVRVPPPRAVVTISVAPPPLPVYEQPMCPGDGYLWSPGYWAYGPAGYFWVPGTWVQPPRVGLLWTPGYWAAEGASFTFHEGYWGARVGFYGGVNYGGGYIGVGYAGGRWVNNEFHYNAAVTNVNVVNVHNVYRETVVNNVNIRNTTINNTTINNTTINNVSYSGGAGGVRATPTAAEMEAARQPHVDATPAQRQHHEDARANPELQAARNQGHPPIAATPRPSVFNGPGVTHPAGMAGHEGGDVRPHPAAAPAPAMPAARPADRPAERIERAEHVDRQDRPPGAAPAPAPVAHPAVAQPPRAKPAEAQKPKQPPKEKDKDKDKHKEGEGDRERPR